MASSLTSVREKLSGHGTEQGAEGTDGCPQYYHMFFVFTSLSRHGPIYSPSSFVTTLPFHSFKSQQIFKYNNYKITSTIKEEESLDITMLNLYY